MKNLKSLLLLFVFATALVSCDDNDALLTDPTDPTVDYDAEIYVSEDRIDNELEESIDAVSGENLKVRVTYKADDEAIVYILLLMLQVKEKCLMSLT